MRNAILNNIDLPLLKKQKRTLVTLLQKGNLTDVQKNHIEGILNLLDDIHDQLDPVSSERGNHEN